MGVENTAKTIDPIKYSWQERALIAEERSLKAEAELAKVLQKLQYVEAQLRLLTAKRFGRSSEKTNKNQLQLFEDAFNEAEATAEPLAPEPELVTVQAHKRTKSKGKKGINLEGLPENVVEYRLPEEELICSCGHGRHIIGQEVTKELVVVPAQFSVTKHVQYVYSCRHCETHGDGSALVMVKAPKLNRAFPGSIASPSAVAHVIEEKYVMGVPLYRQEQQWSRRGVNLSRQNMANWIMHAQHWLQPIYDRMKEKLLEQGIIHADETTIQVLQEDGKKAESQSYMWLYRSGRASPGIVLFEYQPTRSGEHPKGFLVTDAYAGYNGIPDVTRVSCWAHARRDFDETIKAAGRRAQDPKSLEGLKFCNALFDIERELEDLDPQERFEQRLQRSKPVLEAFLAWLEKTSAECVQQSHLGKAVSYCLKHWKELNNFLLDGRLELSNNRAERSIKPFVIGRKNFLFCITPRGARASATTYSVVESAKENGLKSFEYLKYLFTELPNATAKDLDEFLPWSETIPDYCRTTRK
jgi:transposase